MSDPTKHAVTSLEGEANALVRFLERGLDLLDLLQSSSKRFEGQYAELLGRKEQMTVKLLGHGFEGWIPQVP